MATVPILEHELDVALGLHQANRVARAALKEAEGRSAKISVSVCDPQGRLIVHQKMDGAPAEASIGSIGKAIAAVSFRGASDDTTKIVEGYGPAGEVRAEGAPLISRKGGLPMFRLNTLIGAVGVSGASDEKLDEQCARAGVLALDDADRA